MDPDLASVTNWSAIDGPQSPERIFRVVMAGESSVGKTCFMYRFCTGEFYLNMHATVGKNLILISVASSLNKLYFKLDVQKTASAAKMIRTHSEKSIG